jgi:hypothetical protein
MSRRNFLADILPGSVVALAGVTMIGSAITPRVAEATQTAQTVMVRPHRHMRSRHRRWVAGGRGDVAGGTGDIVSVVGADRRPSGDGRP